jgi:hypothetical protein
VAIFRIGLDADKDLDEIILGIPIAALKTICADLADARDEWAAMLRRTKTIQTQVFQVWLNKSLSECGWKTPEPGAVRVCRTDRYVVRYDSFVECRGLDA